jgi:hypothetical protein
MDTLAPADQDLDGTQDQDAGRMLDKSFLALGVAVFSCLTRSLEHKQYIGEMVSCMEGRGPSFRDPYPGSLHGLERPLAPPEDKPGPWLTGHAERPSKRWGGNVQLVERLIHTFWEEQDK